MANNWDDEFPTEIEDEIQREVEQDIWSLGTISANVIRNAHRMSDDQRLEVFALAIGLTELFGEDFEGGED